MTNIADPLSILQEFWGFDSFRDSQLDIVNSVLAGSDTLALLPTGGGKSICFQVPAMAREGVCIVISPLIALMKDQVYHLKKKNVPAEAIYSGMHYRDLDRVLDNAVYGGIKLLYMSPERLSSELAIERIKKMNVNLIAVDEAHCISQWGYDFRPSYLKINEIRTLHPNVPVLALTATATKEVVDDIQQKLDFKKSHVIHKSFERKNLTYVVLKEDDKLKKLLEILKKISGSSVVYVRNRKKTKETALFLLKHNISADIYHAGLSNDDRTLKQQKWINNELRVIVATNAFGMGIDKPDVRTVIHLDLPDSLEAYFQEAGRAGRDGQQAYSVLLYAENDRIRLNRNFELSFPELKEIRKVYRALGSYYQLALGAGLGRCYDFVIEDFSRKFNFDLLRAFNILRILDKEGYISLSEAVFVPSKLHVKLSKVELYDFLIKNNKYEDLLKTVLRVYQGAFKHHISFNEKQLARHLDIKLEELQQQLSFLNDNGIVTYTEQKNKPQITFLTERIDPENLVLDMILYKEREGRHRSRIEAALKYVAEEKCRNILLLNYFGQEAKNCGRCDVCRERNKSKIGNKEFDQLKQKIEWLLEKERLDIKELAESFSPKRREKVLKVLDHLLDEDLVIKENDILIWKK